MLNLANSFQHPQEHQSHLAIESVLTAQDKYSSDTHYRTHESFNDHPQQLTHLSIPLKEASRRKLIEQYSQRIIDMRLNKIQMKAKYKVCIDRLSAQLQHRQVQNCILKAQVTNLSKEVKETHSDLLAIRQYMSNNKSSEKKIQNKNLRGSGKLFNLKLMHSNSDCPCKTTK